MIQIVLLIIVGIFGGIMLNKATDLPSEFKNQKN